MKCEWNVNVNKWDPTNVQQFFGVLSKMINVEVKIEVKIGVKLVVWSQINIHIKEIIVFIS
jgi:hypothetical protein